MGWDCFSSGCGPYRPLQVRSRGSNSVTGVSVNAGDVDRLISNPKFLRLLENPRVQEIGRRVLR